MKLLMTNYSCHEDERKMLKNIADLLMQHSGNQSIAIKCEEDNITYDELCSNVRVLASSITFKNDCIGILMDNSMEYLEAFFAIVYSGNTVIPINQKLAPKEIELICEECNIVGIFSVSEYRKKIEGMEKILIVWYLDEICLSKVNLPDQNAIMAPVAVMIPTSDTTGKPKYVMLSHESIFHRLEYENLYYKRKKCDKEAIILSLCSVLAQNQMLNCISKGMQIVFIQRNFDAYKLCELFVKECIVSCTMVPAMLRLFGTCAERGKYRFLSLKRIFYAGDYLAEEDFASLKRQLPNVRLVQAYGMTEICPICMKDEDNFEYKPRSAGKVFSGIAIKIMEDSLELEKESVGEIYVKGPNMMEGYHKEENCFQDGFFATGDIGYIDEENYLYICGRKKNLIISAGQNIYPEEVEAVLQRFPGIKEIKVYGIGDVDRGEVVAADIVLESDILFNRNSFIGFCRNSIAEYKIPKIIHICESIEKTVSNKKMRK